MAPAVAAYEAGLLDLTWERLEGIAPKTRARHAAEAYVRSGLACDPERLFAELRTLADNPAVRLSPSVWTNLLGPVFASGQSDLARALFARLEDEVAAREQVSPRVLAQLEWMRRWIDREPTSASAPAVPAGTTSFAMLAYGHPGRRRASANIGDHIQSLAALGHVVRREGLTFSGDRDLADMFTALADRVPERLRVAGPARDIRLVTVERDASTYAVVPPETWTLAFGWYMHALFHTRYGFPLHDNLLPLFVSFHCNKRGMMTPEAVEYLRRYGPIGCRDWTTVDLLLSMGVPAFFSGCLTTTVGTVFPDLEQRPGPDVAPAYVDVDPAEVPPRATAYRHSDDAIRTTPFVDNLRRAVELLDTYRTQHGRLVTSRLHAYLPARSLGIPAQFRPPNASDPRFAGLIPLDDDRRDRIADGISTLLDTVLGAILSGQRPDEVYALWRSLTADRVREAQQRRDAPTTVARESAPVPRVLGSAKAAPSAGRQQPAPTGGDGDVVVVVGPAKQDVAAVSRQLPRLVATVREHVPAARVTLIGPGAGRVDLASVGSGVPSDGVRVVRTDGTERDVVVSVGELLPDVRRAVVLRAGADVPDDLVDLVRLDCAGHPFAARPIRNRAGASGFGVIEGAALRMGPDAERSTELRRVAFRTHTFDFDPFACDVLVVDLDVMRAQGFAEHARELAATYRLTLDEVLHLQAGPHYAEIPSAWLDEALRR